MRDKMELLRVFIGRFRIEQDVPDAEGGLDVPIALASDPRLLGQLYEKLPARFPPLYERLICSFRWQPAWVGEYRLLGNPPGKDFHGLEQQIFKDRNLAEVCIKNGYIYFGFRGESYDPICFNTNGKQKGRNFEIVILDHEQILCNSKIYVVMRVAKTFDDFVVMVTQSRDGTA